MIQFYAIGAGMMWPVTGNMLTIHSLNRSTS